MLEEPKEMNDEQKNIKLTNKNVLELSDLFKVRRQSNYYKMNWGFFWVLRFINDCRGTSKLCYDFFVEEILNSGKCFIRFIHNSYLSNTKTDNWLDVFTDLTKMIRMRTKITEFWVNTVF